MKMIKPDAEILRDNNPYKLVERIGRTCYKSEDKITDDSYKKFVFNLIKREHFAMLEHGRVEFAVEGFDVPMEAFANIPAINVKMLTEELPIAIVNVSLSHLYNPKWSALYPEVEPLFEVFKQVTEAAYIEADEAAIQEAAEDGITIRHQANYLFPYATIKFICDRGVSHEFARHRCAVAQESTRYVNYANGKYGEDICFVEPTDFDNWADSAKSTFKYCCQTSEDGYKRMVNEYGMTPQQARAVLPNALKTEIILTMPRTQWNHFFNLRYFGTTGKPHPDAERVAGIAYSKYSLK